jgi:hypothetical protein
MVEPVDLTCYEDLEGDVDVHAGDASFGGHNSQDWREDLMPWNESGIVADLWDD